MKPGVRISGINHRAHATLKRPQVDCVSEGNKEKAGLCTKKEKKADTAFNTCEGAALSGSGFLVPTNRAFLPSYHLAVYIDSKFDQ